MRNTEKPNLFVIGAAKCGTSSLHSYLDQHPDISMSRVKEPRYFLQEVDLTKSVSIKDRRRYLALFQDGARIRGESTVAYSNFPRQKGVPAAIAAEAPGAKFLYLVRDPVERIPAMVRQAVSVGRVAPEDPTVAVSVRDWIGDPGDSDNPFLASGRYMMQIRKYLEFFPEEAIMVIDSNDLRSRRRETMDLIFRFLGCDPAEVDGDFEQMENVGAELTVKPAGYRWLRSRRILRKWYRARPDSLRGATGGRVGNALGRPIPRPLIDSELRQELEAVFRPEVEQLREFTGQEFQGWSI